MATDNFTNIKPQDKVQAPAVTQDPTIQDPQFEAFSSSSEPAPEVTPEAAPTPEVVNKADLLQNIQTTSKDKGMVTANEAFIQGVAKYATGKAATAEDLAAGGTVADVIGRFGIGEQLEGYGFKTNQNQQ